MKFYRPLPPTTDLRARFVYDPVTGDLHNRATNHNNTRRAGSRAGSIHKGTGRRSVRIGSHDYYTARIIWKLVTGADPAGEVDHADRDRLNERWHNLRDGTQGQNQANKTTWAVSGFKGVSYRSRNGKKPWQAHIRFDGRTRHLRYFATAQEAADAYDRAAIARWGNAARTNAMIATERRVL